ncbi:hypothetical protein ACFFP0_11105 [Rhizobium puerariae]|uniref:Response regulator n=1 Tax=Rhizobium puerariae TaxID=1585791 RepID=A0ABV6AFP5_9HYPH
MRILIVDLEYLVAMEAERILGDAFQCDIQIAMPHEYPAVLENQTFDIVLIDSGLARKPEGADDLRAAGVGVVFSTFLDEELAGLADWPGVAVVPKPFDEEQLTDAVGNAARDRATLP